jgi:cytochrome P450
VTGGDRPRGGTLIADQYGAGLMLNMMDDPRHRRIRGLVNKGFTPHRIAALEPELRRRARAILDAVPASGACDFVADVARDLPLQAICLLLGVPQQDRAMLCEWMDRGLEAESGEALNREYGRMLSTYGVELIRKRREKPGDDLLSVVIQARMPEEDPPALGDDELMFFFSLLFTAGSETTRKAIAGGLKALVESPAELMRLLAEPALLETAIEEIVRWTTPSVYKRRTATCDLELHGEKVRAGEKVTFWEMSANRDERVFAEPFRFDVGRDPNFHLGFGQGVHYCLGANLARLEMRVMFEELFVRYEAFESTGPATWTRENRLLGLKQLPVRMHPRRKP